MATEIIQIDPVAYDRLTRTYGKRMVKKKITAVNKGAKALDTHVPAWHNRVYPNDLDLACSSFCVVGQVFGQFSTFELRKLGVDISKAYQYGFDAHYDIEEDKDRNVYKLLDELWTGLIYWRARRGRKVKLKAPA
jgi:hypothetical protein